MSTIEVAKSTMDWVHQTDRKACRNCQHVERIIKSPTEKYDGWRCEKGGFYTCAFAICRAWEAA